MSRWLPWFCLSLALRAQSLGAAAAGQAEPVILRGAGAVEAVFSWNGRAYQWMAYRDTAAKRDWGIGGPRLSLATADHGQTNLQQTGFEHLTMAASQVILETTLAELSLEVRQVFSFCADGRTLRVTSFLRSPAERVMVDQVGLWISPSSLYPFALDNRWLASSGYEVTPHEGLGLNACLAKGGRYQTAFKNAALSYAREARLAHMKFDGFVARCDVPGHGHKTGLESCLPIAEGLMEVFDALRAFNPDIALEPTCFGYQPSPWWLMHVPFIIGPFGDDSPYGRCPAPDSLESMTTAREIKNLRGRAAFLMPSASLQCFDLVVQCPGALQHHAAMAVGRGRWFISSYINPKFMDPGAWRFFADLMKWARRNRDFLREPLPFGGDPERREAYGYSFLGESRQVYCLRNPWMEENTLSLLQPFDSQRNLELRLVSTAQPHRAPGAGCAPAEPAAGTL